jgi:hypothetical protein
MVCFRHIIVYTLHKGGGGGDDDKTVKRALGYFINIII